MEETYVIGHKNPDTDSIISAVVLSALKGYKAVRAGEINPETAFVLNYFEVEGPELLEHADGKRLFLVDHNEATQMVDGASEADILGIIDHHKVQFTSQKPLYMHLEPVGSTATIIGSLHLEELKSQPKLAGLLLGAIMSDTVVFKSPTTTETDKKIAEELRKIAGITDLQAFGLEVKKSNSSIKNKNIKDVISADFKDFDMSGKKVGIGQTEVVDMAEVEERRGEIIEYMEGIKMTGYDLVVFAATDIIKEGSELFFIGDKDVIEKSFGITPGLGDETTSVYITGMMSRKKQIVPPLEEFYKNAL